MAHTYGVHDIMLFGELINGMKEKFKPSYHIIYRHLFYDAGGTEEQ